MCQGDPDVSPPRARTPSTPSWTGRLCPGRPAARGGGDSERGAGAGRGWPRRGAALTRVYGGRTRATPAGAGKKPREKEERRDLSSFCGPMGEARVPEPRIKKPGPGPLGAGMPQVLSAPSGEMLQTDEPRAPRGTGSSWDAGAFACGGGFSRNSHWSQFLQAPSALRCRLRGEVPRTKLGAGAGLLAGVAQRGFLIPKVLARGES